MTAVDLSVAGKLASQGVPLEVIAAGLDVPLATLTRSIQRTALIPEDEQLANGMRQLAWRAWAEAMDIMENGHPDHKIQVIRTVLSKTAGLIGQESTSSFEETKAAIGLIFAQMTDVAAADRPAELPVPETSVYVSPSPAPTRGAHGSDAPADDEPPQSELDPWA